MITYCRVCARWLLSCGFCALTAAGCTVATAAGAGAVDDRAVVVHVTVTPIEGSLPSGLVVVAAAEQRIFAAKLDAQGNATITCEFPTTATDAGVSLPVVPPPGAHPAGVSMSEWEAAASEADRVFVIPSTKRIELVAGQSDFSVSFSLAPAVQARGQVKDANGVPLSKFNVHRANDNLVFSHPPLSPRFRVNGLERNKSNWVFFDGFNESQVRIVPVSASQTATDFDMGDITLTKLTLDSFINIVVGSVAGVPKGLDSSYISLVGVNGTDAFRLAHRVGSRATWVLDATTDSKVAAGQYFVVPGTCANSTSVTKVLRLLAAGRRADLEAAGVPLITTSPTTTATLTIDAGDIIARINGIAE